jgi:hypothetical protein
MTVHGVGEITTQDVGAALSQAGTILNPGTYTTTYNGGVLYTPPAPAGAPGPIATMNPTTILLIIGAFLLFSRGGK